MSHNDYYSVPRNMQIICDSLKTFGIDSVPTGRNDIHVGDRKISGSAFKYASQRGLHHGTVLIDVNLQQMTKYLNPNKKKLESKGLPA
jgi:lipoate-protein ligase A